MTEKSLTVIKLAHQEAQQILDEYWDGTWVNYSTEHKKTWCSSYNVLHKHVHHGLNASYKAINPVPMMTSYGITVYDTDLPLGTISLCSKQAHDRPKVFVSDHYSPSVRRVTMAYQLGHVVDRTLRGQKEYAFREKVDLDDLTIYDLYAHYFAAHLLIPDEHILHDIKNPTVTLTALEEKYGVTKECMMRKLRTITVDKAEINPRLHRFLD